MFIDGAREWIGQDAHTFLFVRTLLEQQLLACNYDYFCGGIISKRSVYDNHTKILGTNFSQILIDFSFKDDKYIISPEYTFRVYEYLNRSGLLNKENKVFYSQEMMRNERLTDIKKGKTFSFWQIGYEIFGRDDTQLSIESMRTLIKCLQSLPLEGFYFRVADKRIFNSLCEKYFIEDKENVLSILEDCNESGNLFYEEYTQNGGSLAFAQELRHLLTLSENRKLTFDILKESVNDIVSREAINNLETICNVFNGVVGQESLVLTPLMTKTWDAYTTFICDIRVPGYDKAIAGGGNLLIDSLNPNCVHSGAGIGVTRIAEYLISRGFNFDSEHVILCNDKTKQ